MKNTIVKDAIVLFLITLIAGAALGLVHEITLAPIAAAQQKAANETYRNVLPEAENFVANDALTAAIDGANAECADWGFGKVTVNDILEAQDASGAVIGYVVNATSHEGYGGDVKISVGFDTDKKITGMGFLSLSETPGLGMRAKTEPWFTEQFTGKDGSAEIERVKSADTNEHQFQGISGASYTSGAVSNALNAAIKFLGNTVG